MNWIQDLDSYYHEKSCSIPGDSLQETVAHKSIKMNLWLCWSKWDNKGQMIKPSTGVNVCSLTLWNLSQEFISGEACGIRLGIKTITGPIPGAKDHVAHKELQFWLPPIVEFPAAISKASSTRDASLRAPVTQHHTPPHASLCWTALSTATEQTSEFKWNKCRYFAESAATRRNWSCLTYIGLFWKPQRDWKTFTDASNTTIFFYFLSVLVYF